MVAYASKLFRRCIRAITDGDVVQNQHDYTLFSNRIIAKKLIYPEPLKDISLSHARLKPPEMDTMAQFVAL